MSCCELHVVLVHYSRIMWHLYKRVLIRETPIFRMAFNNHRHKQNEYPLSAVQMKFHHGRVAWGYPIFHQEYRTSESFWVG